MLGGEQVMRGREEEQEAAAAAALDLHHEPKVVHKISHKMSLSLYCHSHSCHSHDQVR